MMNEKGFISFSLCILLSFLMSIALMLYFFVAHQQNSFLYLREHMMARNCTIDLLHERINMYKKDKVIWDKDTSLVEDRYDFSKAILLEDRCFLDKQGDKLETRIYLFHDSKSIYLLMGETKIDNITNQVCVYLEKKDDECIVRYWER